MACTEDSNKKGEGTSKQCGADEGGECENERESDQLERRECEHDGDNPDSKQRCREEPDTETDPHDEIKKELLKTA